MVRSLLTLVSRVHKGRGRAQSVALAGQTRLSHKQLVRVLSGDADGVAWCRPDGRVLVVVDAAAMGLDITADAFGPAPWCARCGSWVRNAGCGTCTPPVVRVRKGRRGGSRKEPTPTRARAAAKRPARGRGKRAR